MHAFIYQCGVVYWDLADMKIYQPVVAFGWALLQLFVSCVCLAVSWQQLFIKFCPGLYEHSGQGLGTHMGTYEQALRSTSRTLHTVVRWFLPCLENCVTVLCAFYTTSNILTCRYIGLKSLFYGLIQSDTNWRQTSTHGDANSRLLCWCDRHWEKLWVEKSMSEIEFHVKPITFIDAP